MDKFYNLKLAAVPGSIGFRNPRGSHAAVHNAFKDTEAASRQLFLSAIATLAMPLAPMLSG